MSKTRHFISGRHPLRHLITAYQRHFNIYRRFEINLKLSLSPLIHNPDLYRRETTSSLLFTPGLLSLNHWPARIGTTLSRPPLIDVPKPPIINRCHHLISSPPRTSRQHRHGRFPTRNASPNSLFGCLDRLLAAFPVLLSITAAHLSNPALPHFTPAPPSHICHHPGVTRFLILQSLWSLSKRSFFYIARGTAPPTPQPYDYLHSSSTLHLRNTTQTPPENSQV